MAWHGISNEKRNAYQQRQRIGGISVSPREIMAMPLWQTASWHMAYRKSKQ